MLILVGIEESDGQEDIDWLCKKIVNLRIFDDENGVMNKSILEDGGEILVISQFTLHASTKKGNRPSYIKAAKPDVSIPLYEQFCKDLSGALGKYYKVLPKALMAYYLGTDYTDCTDNAVFSNLTVKSVQSV